MPGRSFFLSPPNRFTFRAHPTARRLVTFDWTPIRYRNVIGVLKVLYAGTYAYGKSEKRTALVEGRLAKSYGHGKPVEQWEVMLKGHHDGYIDWAEFERNQKQLAVNAYGRVDGVKSGRGGPGRCLQGCSAARAVADV